MELGLRGKTALVLAASKGLGRACAAAFAGEGANVVIGSRDEARLRQSAKEIEAQSNARVLPVPVDVTDPAAAQVILEAAEREFGRIDILVNNAGGPPFGAFETFTDDHWHKALELNLMSAIRFSRMVLPGMKAACWGRIINIVSLGTKSVLPGSVLSTAGRLGIIGMAKLLADEVAASNITVNNVASGIILTDRVRETSLRTSTPEEIASRIPMRRMGEPHELAALVAFLASEQASYITGTTIPVDGGMIRSIT